MSGILVVAEQTRGILAEISKEMIGAALSIKESLGGPLNVLIIGPQAETHLHALNVPGVDTVSLVTDVDDYFDAAIVEQAVCAVVESERHELVLFGHTSSGMSVAAGVAVRLGSGFAADVTALSHTEAGLAATRSGYGGKVNIEQTFPDKPITVLTVRGATFKVPQGEGSAEARHVQVDMGAVDKRRAQHESYIEAPSAGVDISKSEFILSIGRGIQDEKNVPRFAELAERLGATLGCSRPVADSGWLHKAHQVGLTGKVAANCKLYVALGISGAVQHLHGMKHVETIIAVNTDPNAPIFNHATYGVVMDVFAFAEALEALGPSK